jgi:hypothetical protein
MDNFASSPESLFLTPGRKDVGIFTLFLALKIALLEYLFFALFVSWRGNKYSCGRVNFALIAQSW